MGSERRNHDSANRPAAAARHDEGELSTAGCDRPVEIPAPSPYAVSNRINVGEVMVKAGDIFGDGVNIAARLQALADPGWISVSRGVRDHISNKAPGRSKTWARSSTRQSATLGPTLVKCQADRSSLTFRLHG
jgi:class 3 adenylate cyclase